MLVKTQFAKGKMRRGKSLKKVWRHYQLISLVIDEDTLLVVVDTHKTNYVESPEVLKKAKKIVIIDHHRRSPDIIEGALLNYIEVYASSTSELVTELIQYMLQKPKISKIEAEGLLGGIFMDTKGFQFKSGVRTFDAAAFLRSLGADTIEVKKMFTDSLEDYLLTTIFPLN